MSWSDVQESLGDAFGKLDSLAKFAAILTGAVGVVCAFNGFLEFKTRAIWWIVMSVLFALAATQKRVITQIIQLRPEQTTVSEPRWWWGTVACIGALLVDSGIQLASDQTIVHVRGPFFMMADQYPAPAPRSVASAEGVTPSVPASSATSDCTDWLTAPQDKWVDLVRDRARLLVDGEDRFGPMDEELASVLYGAPLQEHFGFQVLKPPSVREVVIENVEVVVETFISCLPEGAAPAAPQRHRDILVVELERKPCEELPWKFGVKYLLDNPDKGTVTPWGRASVSIADDFERTFLVKVAAKDTGIYVYTANLIVRSAFGQPQTIPLVREPRSVFFIGPESQTPAALQFWSHVRSQLPMRALPVADVPPPPDIPPAPVGDAP